jgi:hypothetical protein
MHENHLAFRAWGTFGFAEPAAQERIESRTALNRRHESAARDFAPVEGARSLSFYYGWTRGIIEANWRSIISATLLSI